MRFLEVIASPINLKILKYLSEHPNSTQYQILKDRACSSRNTAHRILQTLLTAGVLSKQVVEINVGRVKLATGRHRKREVATWRINPDWRGAGLLLEMFKID